MKLIDLIASKSEEPKDYIMDCACPSAYGPEYDRYEDRCRELNCKECWEQEVEEE